MTHPTKTPTEAVAQPDASTDPKNVRAYVLWGVAILSLIVCVFASTTVDGATLWGIFPIILFAGLCIGGMDIVPATAVSLVSGLILAKSSITEITGVLGAAMADQITMIGLIIMLGAGVGEILNRTGVASNIVRAVMRVFGNRGPRMLSLGVMIACAILVASLGTLAGALAIAAPVLIPITARIGFTKSANAAMMFIGGCAGLAIAPFAGSNIAIMDAAEISYLEYVSWGAGPLFVLSLVIGFFFVPWIQKRTAKTDDLYAESELPAESGERVRGSGIATAAFSIALLASVVYATIFAAGTTFPLLALPLLAIITALAGRMKVSELLAGFYKGSASLVGIFILFWLLAAFFQVIELLAPFEVLLEMYGSEFESASPLVFSVLIALLGWVGVPGATAAQVVLLDKIFGDLGASIGVTAQAWTIVLLFASKADTYGPFPNGNMASAMGIARSQSMKNMLITGWAVLVPACVMYAIMLIVWAG